jgi:hypothetical protein
MVKFYAIAAVALVAAAPPRAGSGGVTVALPPGWHATEPGRGRAGNPLTRLVVASGAVRPRLTGACHSQVADYAFPPAAVAVVVVVWTEPLGGMRIGCGPRRPLPVRRPPAIGCWPGPGGGIQFAEHGRSFAAYVLLGRRAPAALAARARGVLDTLRVAPR